MKVYDLHEIAALARRKASSAGISLALPSLSSFSRLSASALKRLSFSFSVGSYRLRISFLAS